MTTATSTPDRNETIKLIRTALKQRSGKAWSVTGGQGTAWGWITITVPPSRRDEFGYMSDDDRSELGKLLGLDSAAHCQGVDVPAGSDYRREYIDRANGRAPVAFGVQYWD